MTPPRTVLATPWFRVEKGDRYVIHETNGRRGAAVLVLDAEDAAALLLVHRPAIGATSLEAPRGYAEAGESAPQAAAREFREETGYAIPPGSLTHLGETAPNTGLLSTRVQLFAARAPYRFRDAAPPRDREAERLLLLPRAALPATVAEGRVLCAITLALLARSGLLASPSDPIF